MIVVYERLGWSHKDPIKSWSGSKAGILVPGGRGTGMSGELLITQ